MSVATKNPFALLDAEEPSSPPPPPQDTPPVAPASTRGQQKSRGGPAARGGKYYARGGAKALPADAPPADDPPADAQRRTDGGRGRGRGRGGRGGPGGPGGGGGDGGAPRGGRRPFDKHSQTGKTDSEKKIHQSWGGDDGNAELKTEEAATVDAAADAAGWGVESAPLDEWAVPEPSGADAPTSPDGAAGGDRPDREGRPRRDRDAEEDDNTLTLEQYLAQQKDKESAIPKLENARRANEGADANWKDVVPLNKSEEEDAYFVGKVKSAPKPKPKKEEKVFIEIDARFERPDRGGGGGRGGRGRGDRGGGDRGGDRGDRPRGGGGGPRRGAPGGNGGGGGPGRGARTSNAPVVNVDDQNAFPSLA